MGTWTQDAYMRKSVLITLLWLIAMLLGGLALLQFGDAIQSALA